MVSDQQVAQDAALDAVLPKLLIGGEWVDAQSGKTFPTVNPATEATTARVPLGGAADIDKAVKAARKAFDSGPWPRATGRVRGNTLLKLADLLEQNVDTLAMLESLDVGKPYAGTKQMEMPLVIECLRYFAGWADKVHGKTIPCGPTPFGPVQAQTVHEPIGVCGLILPFNVPLLSLLWKAGPALAAGNSIVIKPAEQTPLSALLFGKLALEAGIPPGTVNIVTGYGEAGAALVAHPQVDMIGFTGSGEVGKLVLKSAADTLKKVSVELGGKSPLIINKDANIDQAVAIAHMGLFLNSGQACSAASRTYVHADIHEEFVKKMTAAANSIKVGDPFDAKTQQGPQVDKDQFDKVLHYIEVGKKNGAVLKTGGARHGSKGYYIEPTIFTDVRTDMQLAREEIFGPVQSIIKFDSAEQVIQQANDSPYGLAAGVISNDINFVNQVSRNVRAGTIYINCYHLIDPAVPFGGFKQSGIGRDKGKYALSNYTQVKAIYQPLANPSWT